MWFDLGENVFWILSFNQATFYSYLSTVTMDEFVPLGNTFLLFKESNH